MGFDLCAIQSCLLFESHRILGNCCARGYTHAHNTLFLVHISVRVAKSRARILYTKTHPGGGVSIFQKCPNFSYLIVYMQYYLYMKCLKFKNVPT